MLRPLKAHLNPETFSWAAGYALLEAGIASCLAFLGVGGGLTLAWMLVAGAVFAASEPGLCAWLWIVIAAGEGDEAEKRDTDRSKSSADDAGEGPSGSSGSSPTSPADLPKEDRPDPQLVYQKKLAVLLASRSSNIARALEIFVAVVLALGAFFGSHWATGRMPPPEQAALQRSIDQLRNDLNNCTQKVCGGSVSGGSTDHQNVGGNSNFKGGNSGGGNDGGNSSSGTNAGGLPGGGLSYPDPTFRRELVDAVKEASKPSGSSWTNSTAFGVSVLVLLLIAAGMAVVALVRKRPETAAPLGAVGLAAGAIKEAEHLSRLDTTSYRIAEIAFLILLGAFVLLAWQKLRKADQPTLPPRDGDEQGRSKVESPLSLLFSCLVLLWALLAICYRQQAEPLQPGPAPTQQKVSLDFLPSIPGFLPGKPDALAPTKSLEEVAEQLLQQAKNKNARPEDMLVLLGSADCTALRKPRELSNTILAEKRAEALATVVEGMKVFSVDHVIARSLYQSKRCSQSADLRAVFPLLIRQESTAIQ